MGSNLRVYFVGSHATGKTTMTRYVNKRYGLPMITEVARSVLSEMEMSFQAIRSDMELIQEYQRRVFHRQIEEEKAQTGGFVSDRAFDNLAYAAEHASSVRGIVGPAGAECCLGYILSAYLETVKTGVVFFVRPEKEFLVHDGVRAGVDWESVCRIDGMIKLLLEWWGIPYMPLATPSLQERTRIVDFVLQERIGK